MKHVIAAALLALAAQPLSAQEMQSYDTTLSFEDVTFGLENAIANRGLRLEHVSHVGEMLERTRGEIGSDVVLFENAKVFSFCSARLSRQVMEADPMNITYCPYDIFVAQLPDSETVTIGFRPYPPGDMQLIQNLLDSLVQEAIEE